MKTTRLALLLAALAASTYGSDAKVTLDSNNGSSAFLVRDSVSNELARVSSDGKVGIGTTTPAATLDVHGASGTTLKVVDGNQAAGKVLTSDAAGNASWQTAAGGTVKYIQLTMSAFQGSLANGTTVAFDTSFKSNGMTSTGNGINLKAGVTYRLEAALDIYAAAGLGYLGYTISNAGGSLGVRGYAFAPNSTSSDITKNSVIVIYTPTVDETVYVKITDQSMGTGQIRSDMSPYFIATEMTSAGGGAITSVSATGPLASSGGATPTLSILTASGSQTGALAAADWTTFNAKVGGSGTASYVPKFTASGTVGDSAIVSDASGKVGIGTASPTRLLSLAGTQSVISLNNTSTESWTGLDITAKNGAYLATLGLEDASGKFFVDMRQDAVIDFTILQNGNVGIGTTTPVAKLHIAGADMNNALLFENTSANAGRNFILFKTQGAEQGYIGLGSGVNNNMSIAAYGAPNSILLETDGHARMAVLPSGNVGIGTTTPSYTLHVNGSVAGTGAYNALSDARLKKDVQPINDALAIVGALHGVTFNWDQTVDPAMKLDDRNHVGFIAQEVEAVLPQAVSTATDACQTKSVAYSEVIPVLTEAIKQLKAENDALKARLDALEAK